MQDFRKLLVWQKAYRFALTVYKLSRKFPKEEQFSFTSQMWRAALSIPANIAEGCGRSTNADLNRFLHIAMGSACEVECYVLLAKDLGFATEAECVQLEQDITEIKRMLTSFMHKLKPDS